MSLILALLLASDPELPVSLSSSPRAASGPA